MKRILYLLLTLCNFGMLCGQTLHLDLSAHPNREIVLSLKQGTYSDTLFNGISNEKGQVSVRLPETHRGYRGMAVLQPKVTGAYFEFIVAGEDMSLSCDDIYPHGGNVVFRNSPENEFLQSSFIAQAVRRQKIGLYSELERLYSGDDIQHTIIENEKKRLGQEQVAFECSLKNNPLYAARFLELHNFLNNKVATLFAADSLQRESVRRFVADSLDMHRLYTSGMWFNVLNGMLVLYSKDSPRHSDFVTDMAKVLARCNEKVYLALVDNLFSICEATGWNDLEEQLAYFLMADGCIKNPTGKLRKLISRFKLIPGSEAPALVAGSLPRSKTLLVFYETGCGPCENELLQLKANYPLLKEKGYEVVSVSADADKQIFLNTAETFPWKGKYCDGKGFSGADFRNYSVMGTPTFYVIDENGTVQGRYARLADAGVL
ncbi:MAG: thioredoxin family protein [Dysgonamonadaceae bacterium]